MVERFPLRRSSPHRGSLNHQHARMQHVHVCVCVCGVSRELPACGRRREALVAWTAARDVSAVGPSGAANAAAVAEHAAVVSTMEAHGRSPRSLSGDMHADAGVDAAHVPHGAQPTLPHVPEVYAQAPSLRM